MKFSDVRLAARLDAIVQGREKLAEWKRAVPAQWGMAGLLYTGQVAGDIMRAVDGALKAHETELRKQLGVVADDGRDEAPPPEPTVTVHQPDGGIAVPIGVDAGETSRAEYKTEEGTDDRVA